MDLLLMHAKQIIEQLLKCEKPELDWRISEYLCRDEIIHLLLSYISRLPSHINIHKIHSIYINHNNCAVKLINNNILYIDKHRDKDDNDRPFLPQTEQNNISQINDIKQENDIEKQKESDDNSSTSSSDNIEALFELNLESISQKQQENKDEALQKLVVYFEKLSFSLMKILCNSYEPKTVKSFLVRKIKCIIFHSLIVFHPLSYGNILYHSAEILNILLFYWPKQLFQVLTTSNCICIKYLFKYAIISHIHQYAIIFNEFVINLLCFNNNAGNVELQESINKYRCILIDEMLIKWNFLPIANIMLIACNPVLYGEDMSNKYCLFLFNLLKKCALIKETKHLFICPENMLCLIIDKLLTNILDMSHYKINFCFTLQELIKYLYKSTILQVINVPKSQGMTGIITPISSANNIYSLFKHEFKRFGEYIPLIITEIITNNSNSCNSNKKTLGLHRLNCIELLMLYIDIIKRENEDFVVPDVRCLCKALLDMMFVFDERYKIMNINIGMNIVLFKV